MTTGPGYIDADGANVYGEEDVAAPGGQFSDLLNRGIQSIKQVARNIVLVELANLPDLTAPAQLAVTNAMATQLQIPQFIALDGHLIVVLDSEGNHTWLGADTTDGGPTPWAMTLLRDRLNIYSSEQDGILVGFVDANYDRTWLEARTSDGGPTDWAMTLIKEQLGTVGATYADVPYIPGSDIHPVHPNYTRWVIWSSSTGEAMGENMRTLAEEYGATLTKGGKGGEQSPQIGARSGLIPARLTVTGGSIPAAGAVVVTSSNMPANGNLKPFTGWLGGVHGTLSSTSTVITFTRTTAGAAVAVAPDSLFVSELGLECAADVPFLWGGKNDASATVPGREEQIIANTAKMFNALAPLNKFAFVVGDFLDSDTPLDSLERTQILAANAARKARYGSMFIDVQAFMCSPLIWTYSGVAPTAADLTAQANGTKPWSLSLDAGHFNAAGLAALRRLMKDHVDASGRYPLAP